MAKKKPRKVSLIQLSDYGRERYSAYWIIHVDGNDDDGYRWEARIFAYDAPVGWEWQGVMTPERPDLPWPKYPADVPVNDAQYKLMSAEDQAKVQRAQEERRRICAEIYERHPKPSYLVDEAMGLEDERDAADTAAQKWVLAQMPKHKRPPTKPSTQAGFALALGPAGMIGDVMLELGRRLFGPLLMALGIATATRNKLLNVIRDDADAGVGAALIRIYDGTRPATCGTVTTLGAELTCSDPSAPNAASGVLTFSAITADASANASITATWGRLVDSTGTCVFDFSVGTSGSDLNLNSTTITIGQEVAITSATITAPNA